MTERGRRRRFDESRALPSDIAYLAQRVPLARAEASFELAQLAALRSSHRPRISWAALFLKAYAVVAREYVWLRQSYLRWPFPHLYEHAQSTAMCAVTRQTNQQLPRLHWARIRDIEQLPLQAVQQRLEWYQQAPVQQAFAQQLRLSRYPTPLRRLCWWLLLNVSGRLRQRKLGTFSLSTLAGQGVINRDHPSILTTSLSYGPLDDSGRSVVTLIYDHRVFDGMHAALALQRLERVLQREMCDALRTPSWERGAAGAA